jgi:hypothetical protein
MPSGCIYIHFSSTYLMSSTLIPSDYRIMHLVLLSMTGATAIGSGIVLIHLLDLTNYDSNFSDSG